LSKLNNITEQLKNFRIVPVIVIHKAEDAALLADTLLKGGLPCAEITFRTAAALDAIRIMAQRKDLLVGAGTV
jgi:2-dehydro-3-deoxyphosphogluconate aldolase/(4S)-4-hydroxy-2-oxoglutarate aldolase